MPTTTADSAPQAAPRSRRAGAAKSRLPQIITAVLAVVLVVAMAASTKWLSPAQVDQLTPKPFDPAAFAAEKFPEIKTKVTEKAVDLTVLAPAVTADLNAAGAKYGRDLGSGKFIFPVKATGTVKSVDDTWIILDTPDIAGWTVRVPVGTALNGSAIRDVTGDISFGDFTDQTTYQFVADQLRDQVKAQVLDPLGDRAALTGKTVTVTGAWISGGAPNQFIVQPVSVEAR